MEMCQCTWNHLIGCLPWISVIMHGGFQYMHRYSILEHVRDLIQLKCKCPTVFMARIVSKVRIK